jgi:hypothetical protein
MLGANLFFKQPAPARTMVYTHQDAMRDMEARKKREEQQMYFKRPYDNSHNNQAVRPFVGHPRFGFHTMLNHDSFGKLPTAPAVVGGNVDWTKQRVTPATQYLHSVLSGGRPMNPAPALGSVLKLTEPTMHSIHTHY